jgi:hypothetical protein
MPDDSRSKNPPMSNPGTSQGEPRDLDKPQACAETLWRTFIGLDLQDRTVLEGEVLIWRIARQVECQPH